MQESWLCVGDFNDMMSNEEKLGKLPIDVRRVLNFQCMLVDCQLLDLGFQGAKYTWSNRRLGDEHMKERIVRAMANAEFGVAFQNSLVMHVEPVGSNHHLLVVDCEYKYIRIPRHSSLKQYGPSMKSSYKL